MAGALVGYAAIPQNTLRQNAGIVMPTVNATAGYYVGGTQIIDATTAAALATLDTGQGANELYDMDQNVLVTSDVNFSSLETDDLYVRGSYNVTQLAMYPQQPVSYIVWGDPPAAPTIYYAKNGTTGAIDYSGADATIVIQATINSLPKGGKLVVKRGTYILVVALALDDNIQIEGEGSATIFQVCNVIESDIALQALLGQFDVVVTDASNFRVGMQVGIGHKSLGADTLELNRIVDIDYGTNTITMSLALTNTYNVGEYVYSAIHAIEAYSKTGIVLRNFHVDCNKDNNYPYLMRKEPNIPANAIFDAQVGVYFSATTYSKIIGVSVEGAGWAGITAASYSDDNLITGCHVTGSTRHGIIVYGLSDNVIVTECNIHDNGNATIIDDGVLHNLHFEWHSDNCIASNNYLAGCKVGLFGFDMNDLLAVGNRIYDCHIGISIGGPTAPSSDISLIGNYIKSCIARSITLHAENSLVHGNYISASSGAGRDGIYITQDDCSVIGNFITGGGAGVGQRAIRVGFSGSYNPVNVLVATNKIVWNGSECILIDCDDTVVRENYVDGLGNSINGIHVSVGFTGNHVIDNSVFRCTTNNIIDSSGVAEIKRNTGFVTENSGTATLLNGNTAIIVNHGCNYTPSAGDIQVHPIETLTNADFWWVDTITATQFTIHTDQDPGADVDFAWSVDRH